MADSTVKYLNKLTWLRAETKKTINCLHQLHYLRTVCTDYTVYTIQTALHCLNSSMYAYIYIVREG